jgi:hypothetical protein
MLPKLFDVLAACLTTKVFKSKGGRPRAGPGWAAGPSTAVGRLRGLAAPQASWPPWTSPWSHWHECLLRPLGKVPSAPGWLAPPSDQASDLLK